MPTKIASSLLLLLFGIVHASPLSRDARKANLAISTKINAVGMGNIIEQDRARIRTLMHGSQGALEINSGSLNATNQALIYTAEVGIGTPPAYHMLLIDTGSSNTWVGAYQPYVTTNSSSDTGNTVLVSYGSGAFFGEEWLDTVTLTADLVIDRQSIGVATVAVGVNGLFDGILGLGPVDLTQNTVNNTLQVPTVLDNLYSQNKVSQEVLGVFFAPVSESNVSGKLTFGGYDESLTSGSVNYVPLTNTSSAAMFWGIDQSISYGNTTIMSTSSGIVDTGTTLVYVPSDSFRHYQSLTGATLDSVTGLLAINSAQYANLQTLSFNIGGISYDLTPNGQIWPRSLNAVIGGNSSTIYLIVGDFGDEQDINFCNGFGFLQRFYSIFDTTNSRFGIAKTAYTNSNAN